LLELLRESENGSVSDSDCKSYEDGTQPNHAEYGDDPICHSPLAYAIRANWI